MIISTKRVVALSLLIIICASSKISAQSQITRQEYIDRYKHIAVAHKEEFGIPASITMAQGILESSSGNSELSTKSNNHFGIKCKSNWSGKKVYHDDDEKGECFRAYTSVEQSYRDHAEFLDSQPRYDSLFDFSSSDYKSWARGLKKAGYATAPDYAERLIKIIEDNDLQVLDKKNGLKEYAELHGGSSWGATTTTSTQDNWFAESQVGATITSGEGIDPDNYSTTINAHKGYNVYRNNGVFYVVAKSGDSFEQIADFFDLSERRLRKYNDLPRKAPIVTGDVVYIAKKQSKWSGTEQTHTVKSGETIHSVAQEYALTVKSLRRINKLEVKYTLNAGQTINLK